MMESIVLPEKVTSNIVPDLINRMKPFLGKNIVIDGGNVKTISAHAGVVLARYKEKTESDGGSFVLKASVDLLDDLRIIGLSDLLFAKEIDK